MAPNVWGFPPNTPKHRGTPWGAVRPIGQRVGHNSRWVSVYENLPGRRWLSSVARA